MKFGKHLQNEAHDEWSPFYIDYKLLKKVLKGVSKRDGEPSSRNALATFVGVLTSEMQKCSSFFVDKVEALDGLADAFLSRSSEGDSDLDAACLMAAHYEVCDLKRFAFLNYVAVTKAVKKANKKLQLTHEMPPLSVLEMLMPQTFFSSARFKEVDSKFDTLLASRGLDFSTQERPGAGHDASVWEGSQADTRSPAADGSRPGMCPICLEQVCAGVDLECGHTFCARCIAGLVATNRSDVSLVDACAEEMESTDRLELVVSCCPVCQVPRRVTGGKGRRGSSRRASFQSEEQLGEPEEVPGCSSGEQTAPFTVVLDLDHTLIFSVPSNSSVHRRKDLQGLQYMAMDMSHVTFAVHVFLRPGVLEFLRQLSAQGYSLVAFTAGIEPYARPILDALEAKAGVRFARKLFRGSTVRTQHHNTVKDLSCLGTDLRRTVLVDDNPLSFSLQPLNGIPALPFTPQGDLRGAPSYLLDVLLPMLAGLSQEEDVRPRLKDKYNMHGWFARLGVPVERGRGAGRALLVCSLDHGLLTSSCADQLLMSLAPELAGEGGEGERGVQEWNSAFAAVERAGYGPGNIFEHLARIQVAPEPLSALSLAHRSGLETAVVTTSNNLFATRVLMSCKAWKHVTHTYSPRAMFTHTSLVGGGAGASCGFRLVMEESKPCASCWRDTCKACEFGAYRANERTLEMVILVLCDASDLCIARQLKSSDVVFTCKESILESLEDLGLHVRFCAEETIWREVERFIRLGTEPAARGSVTPAKPPRANQVSVPVIKGLS